MDETRRGRHDLRQHLAMVQSFLDQDDKTNLSEYLDIYKNKLPTDILEYFCANGAVNAIISYYAAQARDAGIAFSAQVSYPKEYPVSDTDITVLLGNLLENTVEGCKRTMGNKQFIKLRVKQRGQSMLLILVDNTCMPDVSFEDGTPLSSKRKGMGIGVASVREISSRYNGAAWFEQRDGIFYASVRLMLPQPYDLQNESSAANT